MGLNVVFSNRIEALGELLLDELGRFPDSPFAPQHIVVPSTAVSRYLQLAIARDKGICANVKFSYLGSWLWDLAKVVDDSVPDRSPVDPDVMAWLLLRLLADGNYGSHARLGTFIGSADDLMRFEFAQSLAQVFDHYATYRPDWLTDWSRGRRIPDLRGCPASEDDEGWQSEIWRSVTRELKLGNTHPLQTFLDAVTGKAHSRGEKRLPGSAAVFAVPVIPPLYLQTICRLSEVMEITIYMLNPCREYWFEIVPPQRLAYLKKTGRDAHREVGHRLLADWGRATQAAVDLIYDAAAEAQTPETSYFREPGGNSLLEQLQRSILDMEDLKAGAARISAADRSMEIHCCHGPVRELEVLHNRLLEMFAADRTLKADEVVVLTPDIDALAPSIEAVFGTVPRTHHIPYAIAGRAMASTNPFLQVLLDLLDLLSSRMPASRVFGLLRQDPVARRFGLDDEGLGRIREWLGSSGMRWGLDAAHRGEMRISGEERHTFRWGLDSLFLGFALPDTDGPLAGLLPSESIEGSRAETLGTLWMFIERLARWKDRLRNSQPADSWQGILNELLAAFASCDDSSHGEYETVVSAIADLAGNWRAANLTQPVSSRVVRAALADADVRRRGAVPSGMVTFASLTAMRGLCYRVVCLIGMNDGAYPGRERHLEFDLIRRGKARRGDRQRRMEERGMFLDALMAAGDAVHISYTGRQQRDNAEMPPSVLVAQLIEYLVQATAPEDADAAALDAARRRLTVNHPLQPFSRRYFDGHDPRLCSYVGQYADALNGVAPGMEAVAGLPASDEDGDGDEPELSVPFFNGMPERDESAEDDPQLLTAEDLAGFLRNPSRHFLQRRLLIRLAKADDIIADEEPLDVGFIPERNLAGIAVDACLAHNCVLGMNEVLALLNASPDAPPQTVCEAYLSGIWPKISSLASRLLEATAEPRLAPHRETLNIGGGGVTWRLQAGFGDLRPCGLVRFRCDDLRDIDYLNAWLQHLLLCSARPHGVRLQTRHLAFNEDLGFGEIGKEEAQAHLASLLRLYGEGLLRPVPFFRKSAWVYLEGKGMGDARSKWAGGYGSKSAAEGADIWHALAWRGENDPLGDEFREIAKAVYGPLIGHRVLTPVAAGED